MDATHKQRAHRPAGGGVAESRDLRLVGHDADERESGALGDDARECRELLGAVQRTASHPEVAERATPTRVEFDGDTDARSRTRRDDRVDQVKVGDVVDHEGHARGEKLVGRESGDGRAICRGVAQHDVVDIAAAGRPAAARPAAGRPAAARPDAAGSDARCAGCGSRARKPQRLGQRIGEHARKAGLREHGLENAAHANRLARHTNRHATRATHEVGGVVRECRAIDDAERRVEVGRGGRQSRPVCSRVGSGAGTRHIAQAQQLGGHGVSLESRAADERC